MRLEQLPNLKGKMEELLSDLVTPDVEQINWTVNTDIGERKITVEILPVFKNMGDSNKFGITGESGNDVVGKPRDEDMVYPNSS